MAIGAVTTALNQALDGFKSTLETAGGELRGSGNSLQANAQNVLRDIDSTFKNNLNLTFDRMDAQQRALYRDAQALTRQIQTATKDLTEKTGDQARRTIGEADITAYNASYSLPCRTQTPRIVYVATPRLRVGRDAPEIVVRGNFLDRGTGPARVNGKAAQVIARSSTEARVRVPEEVWSKVSTEGSVSVEIPGEELKRTNFLLFCPTSRKGQALQGAVVLAPRRNVLIAAWVQPSALVEETTPDNRRYDSGKPGDCGINTDVTQQQCAPQGWTVKAFSLSDTSANTGCGSSVGPASASGSSCVIVSGRVRGCGWGVSFLGIRDCKGRGWSAHTLNMTLARDVRQPQTRQDFTADGSDQSSWSFRYVTASELRSPMWSYAARVEVREGNRRDVYDLSNAQENSGPVGARLVDGTLAITLNDGAL